MIIRLIKEQLVNNIVEGNFHKNPSRSIGENNGYICAGDITFELKLEDIVFLIIITPKSDIYICSEELDLFECGSNVFTKNESKQILSAMY